ncbi:hypothetical protein REPUB_Repub03eG0280900 [Reevesia pubescens]
MEKVKEKELVELFEAAKKVADRAATLDGGASEESRCIEPLSQLKNFPITYQLIVSTQVGKQLRCLTKHPRKEIQAFAYDVLQIWKILVIETKNGDDNNGKVANKNYFRLEPATAKLAYAKKVLSEASDDILDEVNACDPIRVATSLESAIFESWGKSNGAKKIRYWSSQARKDSQHDNRRNGK